MKERDELIETLSLIVRPESAAKMVDAFAHALATKIRNSKRLRDYTDDHMNDCNMAADLIDPDVTP